MLEIAALIEQKYLFQDSLSYADMETMIATGMMVGTGDRYATYYDIEALASREEDQSGKMIGIGFEVRAQSEQGVLVERVYPDSPASQAGIVMGDRIVAVDGQSMLETPITEQLNLFEAEEGTSMTLTLERDPPVDVTVVHSELKKPNVTLTMMGSIAYLWVEDFSEETLPQLETALQQAQAAGATGLLFDLRGNDGGLMDAVIESLDVLLPAGDLVYTVDVNGKQTVRGVSDESHVALPTACLMNEYTASAAELFVAALRDYGVTTLVGTTTYGKGVVQSTITLTDGSAVRMTTSYYNPPSGENFDGVGVVPDVEVVLTPEEEMTMIQGDVATDRQLATALSLFGPLPEALAIAEEPVS